jgi:hypothetical protein
MKDPIPDKQKLELGANRLVDELSAIRLLVILNQLRPILRPSARRDLERFISRLKSRSDLEEVIRWGGSVLEADFEERYFLKRPKTQKAISMTRLPIFRRPERSFQIRWMHLPRNTKAVRSAIVQQRSHDLSN